MVKTVLINDNFQNYKRYGIPKAQLVIADIPYNLAKILSGIEMRHGVEFQFCKPTETGRRIVEILEGGLKCLN